MGVLGTQHHKQLELQTLKVAGKNGAKSESQPLNNELENFKDSEMLPEDKSSSKKKNHMEYLFFTGLQVWKKVWLQEPVFQR